MNAIKNQFGGFAIVYSIVHPPWLTQNACLHGLLGLLTACLEVGHMFT